MKATVNLLQSERALAVESVSHSGRSSRFLLGKYDSCSFSNELGNSVFSSENQKKKIVIGEEDATFSHLKSHLSLFILDPVGEAVDQGWVTFSVSNFSLPFFTMQNRKRWFWNLLVNTAGLRLFFFVQEIEE